jgi:hypothetical protein
MRFLCSYILHPQPLSVIDLNICKQPYFMQRLDLANYKHAIEVQVLDEFM